MPLLYTNFGAITIRKLRLLITTVSLGFLLLASFFIELQTVEAQTRISLPARPTAEDSFSYGINIGSPTNNTYCSSSIPLNVTVKRPVNPNDYSFKILYSLNEATNVTIPSTVSFYDKSVPDSMLSFLASYTIAKGFVSLNNLSAGTHNLTIYGIYEHKGPTAGTNFPAVMHDVQTIYFMINNGLPPSIRIIKMQNESYQNNLPIEFSVDEPISWMGYSLDDKTNVTFMGNTTLNELAFGPHKLVVYANDTLGNIGTTGTLNFTIIKPEPFLPEVLLLVIVSSILGLIVTTLLFYRRHRKTSNLKQ
jgi:hypothetical protein